MIESHASKVDVGCDSGFFGSVFRLLGSCYFLKF